MLDTSPPKSMICISSLALSRDGTWLATSEYHPPGCGVRWRRSRDPNNPSCARPLTLPSTAALPAAAKSGVLLVEAVRHQAVHDFTAVLFRRNYPQLTAPGGMWDESAKLLPLLGTTPNRSTLAWQFPSGACVKSTKRSLNS
jgi:hypothetical protein